MTTCPICAGPMTLTHTNGRTRVYCSRRCRDIGNTGRLTPIDPAAVWRLTCGDPVTSTKAERLTATAHLSGHGYSLAQIAALLRVTCKSVSRYRAEIKHRKKAA